MNSYTGFYNKKSEIVCMTVWERIERLKKHIKICEGHPKREYMLEPLKEELKTCYEMVSNSQYFQAL